MSALPMPATDRLETQVAAAREWFARPRFDGIVRLHTAQRGRGPAGHDPA